MLLSFLVEVEIASPGPGEGQEVGGEEMNSLNECLAGRLR